MSQFSHQPPAAPAARGSSGLAIAALVCGCFGLIIPGLGIVAVILGIVALARASTPPGAKGMAIGGLAVGAVSLITSLMCIGILLPAIGKARQSARQLRSSVHITQMSVALHTYASANEDWFPESTDGLDRLVALGLLNSQSLASPHAGSSGVVSYIYLPPAASITEYDNPEQVIVVYENPAIVPRGLNVLYLDGHMEIMSEPELNRRLAGQPKAGTGGR